MSLAGGDVVTVIVRRLKPTDAVAFARAEPTAIPYLTSKAQAQLQALHTLEECIARNTLTFDNLLDALALDSPFLRLVFRDVSNNNHTRASIQRCIKNEFSERIVFPGPLQNKKTAALICLDVLLLLVLGGKDIYLSRGETKCAFGPLNNMIRIEHGPVYYTWRKESYLTAVKDESPRVTMVNQCPFTVDGFCAALADFVLIL